MKKRLTDNSAPEPIAGADSSFLRTLLGYNTRRATLRIFEVFHERMRGYDLNPVEFSVLSLIGHNPGVTAGQICDELEIPAPNLAKIVSRLNQRQLIRREARAEDKRAFHLSLSTTGHKLLKQIEPVVEKLEQEASAGLTDKQREMVNALLQRIYR
ncbi:MAG: MarR family transcriptional regulator [Betaproteobacteria bacterium]|nr:MarR family transcriptional regulator [Betaproteobacteria bacterium]